LVITNTITENGTTKTTYPFYLRSSGYLRTTQLDAQGGKFGSIVIGSGTLWGKDNLSWITTIKNGGT
jgi:hypothetical protein